MKWKPFVDAGRIRNKGRYDGEVRHRRIRPQHLCAEIHDRTAIGGRNQAVYFGRNPLRSGNRTCEKESPLPLFAGTYTLPPVAIGLGWFGYIDKGAD